MANQLVSDEWAHPAERGSEKTYTEKSALEYLTPLMTKYAYERYRYNLTPREVYEILFEGCWESVDDFVQYMQDMAPTPEGVRLYTFEELDAMDAGDWTEECPGDPSEDDDDKNGDELEEDEEMESEEDVDMEFEDDVEMEEDDDELMPFDPLPLYESQCGDNETIIERGRAPSFLQPATPPPEYTIQPSTPVRAEEAAIPEDSDNESDDEELVSENQDDKKAVILSSLPEDSEQDELRADFKRRVEQGWKLDMSIWHSGDLANFGPEKKTDSQEQAALEETQTTDYIVAGEDSSPSSEDSQERAFTPAVQVKVDKQAVSKDTVAWAATTARFPANVNASAPGWVDQRAADRIAAAQITADRVAEGSRRWADRFKKDPVPAKKLVDGRSSEAEAEYSITQSPPAATLTSEKEVGAALPLPSEPKSADSAESREGESASEDTAVVPGQATIIEKAIDTATWTQDMVVQSRRIVASTVVKVMPAALVLAGAVFWGSMQ